MLLHVNFCNVVLVILNLVTNASVSATNYEAGLNRTHKENIRNCLSNSTSAILDNNSTTSDSLIINSLFLKNELMAGKDEPLQGRGSTLDSLSNTFGIEALPMPAAMRKYLPYLILPGLFMAGLLPWVMPGIKMVVSTVTMINQMAFNMALFGLIRSYIFDTEPQEHVYYVNKGYKKRMKPKRKGYYPGHQLYSYKDYYDKFKDSNNNNNQYYYNDSENDHLDSLEHKENVNYYPGIKDNFHPAYSNYAPNNNDYYPAPLPHISENYHIENQNERYSNNLDKNANQYLEIEHQNKVNNVDSYATIQDSNSGNGT